MPTCFPVLSSSSAPRRTLLAAALLALSGAATAFSPTVVNTNITEADVRSAQAGARPSSRSAKTTPAAV